MDYLIRKNVKERGLAMSYYDNDKKKTDLRHGNNIYRACLSKKKYTSYDFAVQMAAKYTEMFGKKQYVYYCPYCFNYHITSLPRIKEEKKGENNV